MTDAVAVTGIGAVSTFGAGAACLADALREGASGIRRCDDAALGLPWWAPLPALDWATAGAALAPMLRQALHRAGHGGGAALQSALQAAAEAWQQAGAGAGDRVGVIVAGSNLNQQEAAAAWARHATGKAVRPSYAMHFMDTDYVGALSEMLSLHGEGFTAGGASGSGGVALALGRRALLSGDVDAVLVVGVPMLLSGAEAAALTAVGAAYSGTAATGCRPFDREAAGFVYGQAGAAIVLERQTQVRQQGRQALALLAGAAMGLDGKRGTHPSVAGEAATMRAALAQAGLPPHAIDLVSAHGSSSATGDQAEAQALREVFGVAPRQPCINAPKALLGHCLAGAGVLEAVAVVAQLQQGFVHGHPTLDAPIDAALRWCGKRHETRSLGAALSNSFGFSGINTSQIFVHPEYQPS